MSAPFAFDQRIEFLPENSDALLRQVPAAPGVFSLRGEAGEPYLTRTADLRRRLRRLLAPPDAVDESGLPILSKRLNLRSKVRFIEYTRTGSDFESALILYYASRAAFGAEEARRRLRLHPPFFLRITMQHEHPRVYTTNRLSKKSLPECFGPFPSRAAAERYCDAVLDLFQLRRCHEDLQPRPDHPGCVYGDIKKCMQPCKSGAREGEQANRQACTAEQYSNEATRVFAFFATRGQSLLDEVARQREAASEQMDFEAAAAVHKLWEKVRAAALLADELVRPVNEVRAIILQEAAPFAAAGGRPGGTEPRGSEAKAGGHVAGADQAEGQDAAVFLLEGGRLTGPERLSTLGVRAVREQTAVGSSLFAQPLMLAAVPLDDAPASPEGCVAPEESTATTLNPEDRARAVIDNLTRRARSQPAPDIGEVCDGLSLFRRWYYRPEKQRAGEVFLPNPDGGTAGAWPIRRILNGAARIVLGPPAAAPPVDREAFKELKTKVIHPGREGVERTVPVLPKRQRKPRAALSHTE